VDAIVQRLVSGGANLPWHGDQFDRRLGEGNGGQAEEQEAATEKEHV
jgi:hypothetical protein